MFRRSGEETHAQKQWDWVSTVAQILVGTIDVATEIALTQFHGEGLMITQRQQRDGGMTSTTVDTGADIVWQDLRMPGKALRGVATVRNNANLI